MDGSGHGLFDTPFGTCGIAWGLEGTTAVQLPEASPKGTRARLLSSLPGATTNPVPKAEPAPAMMKAIASVQALLAGRSPGDLRHIVPDMSRLSAFYQRVFERTRAIPPGQVMIYGELAVEAG